MEKKERIQEYVKKLESLRGLIIACESEAEECLSLSGVRELLRTLELSVRRR